MFRSSTFLKLRETSVYDLKPAITDEKRLEIMENALTKAPKMKINSEMSPYYSAFNMLQKRKEDERLMYENSVLWSPRFTPTYFKIYMVYFTGVALFMFYLIYIRQPQLYLEQKKKGKVYQNTARYIAGWENDNDPLLEFESHSLTDLDSLEEQGIVGDNRVQKLKQKHRKFQSVDKEFILKDFKKN